MPLETLTPSSDCPHCLSGRPTSPEPLLSPPGLGKDKESQREMTHLRKGESASIGGRRHVTTLAKGRRHGDTKSGTHHVPAKREKREMGIVVCVQGRL